MAYCRWSSDDFKCDIYCYKSVSHGDYEIHISDRKTRILEKLPPRPVTDHELDWYYWEKEAEKVIEDSDLETLRLPFNGKSIYFDHPLTTAFFLKNLKNWGYHVPDYAIDRLMHEAKTENHMKIAGQNKEDDSLNNEKKANSISPGINGVITVISSWSNFGKLYKLFGKDSFVEP